MLQYWVGLRYQDPDIPRTVLIVFWVLAEPVRLAAGRYGNLHENVRRHVLEEKIASSPCANGTP
jgi:hypothetical protein